MEHNKGQFVHLSKMTGLKCAAHDGWFWVNLFDTVKENSGRSFTWRVQTYSVLVHRAPFMFQRTHEKFQKNEWRPGLLALTA